MELIKKIKEAESQARQIIDQAKTEAERQCEQNHQSRKEALNHAKQQRLKAIDEAVAKARAEGFEQSEHLKKQSGDERQRLRDNAGSKVAGATKRVMEYLKG